MSYYFQANGEVIVRSYDSEQSVRNAMDKVVAILNGANAEIKIDCRPEYEMHVIKLQMCRQAYDEDNLRSVLAGITPYIQDGELDCVGEPDLWRYIFRAPNWYEEYGEITYDTDHPEIFCRYKGGQNMRTKLSLEEFNAIVHATAATKMDGSFDLEHDYEADVDYFYDFEEDEEISLSQGLLWLYEGIAYPCTHDGLSLEEGELIADILVEFGLADADWKKWFVA